MRARGGAAAPATYEVDALLDGQTFRRSTLVFGAVALLALLSDGFDIAAIGFVAPELVRDWHVPSANLVSVLSAGLYGLLVGGPLLGFMGDRFGRKRAVVVGLVWAGLFTLVSAAASTLTELAVLRFLAGIGLGGVIPNVVALCAEVAPRRWRGRFIMIVGFGVPGGIALPGLVAAALVPRFGWPVLFVVGGLLPLAVAAVFAAIAPESLKFLVQRGGRQARVVRIARAVRPDLPIDADTRFVVAQPSVAAQGPTDATGSPRRLFGDGLAVVTPMLWIAVAANQMANFFTISWLPTLLQATGSGTVQASLTASMFAIGGLVGQFVLSGIVDRFGAVPTAVTFVLAVPLVAVIGLAALPPAVVILVIAAAGFCVTGNNGSANATMAAIYPTAIRSAGIGWAQGVGRLGSLLAPVVGGMLLHGEFALSTVLLAPALTLAVGAAAWIVLTLACIRRFGSLRLREFSGAG